MSEAAQPFYRPARSPNSALAEAPNGATLIDLRKPDARRDRRALPGTVIRDACTPCRDNPPIHAPGRPITFYAHGHDVSRSGCAMLLHGRDAAYFVGGLVAPAEAGAALEDLAR